MKNIFHCGEKFFFFVENLNILKFLKFFEILENFEIKPKVLYITLRQILTGKKYGPSMNDLLTLIRKDEIIKRK